VTRYLAAMLVGRALLFGPGGGGSTAQDPPYVAIPQPRLETLESSVAAQIGQAQRDFETAAAAPGAAGRELADAYGSLARLYHAYEFVEAAEAAYVNAARLDPRDARWSHLLGYLYQQTGRLEEAAGRFVAARRASPRDRAAAVRLGQVYLGLNRLREAREQFDDVATVFPALAQHGLGEVALRERRFSDALGHFRAALERVPQATSIHYQLAMALRGLGRLDAARAQLARRGPGGISIGDPIVDQLQALVLGERGLVIQGRRAFEAGLFQDAVDAFTKALGAAPESVAARANLGLALSRLGHSEAAAEQFERVLRLDADNVIAHAALGQMLAGRGRDSDAAVHLRAARAQAPDDATVNRELVGVLLRLGRQDEAIELLAATRTAAPDDEDALVSLSILLASRERYREAVALLDEADRRLPGRPTATTTLARLLASSPDRSLRDGRRALELAMAVYAAEPVAVHAETVAMALAELGRCDEAAGWMRRAVTAAGQEQDAAESARLRGQLKKYETPSCRQ